MKHAQHIIRFVLVLAVIGIGFLVFRTWLVPDSFGIHNDSYMYGYHRGDSDAEQADLPVSYRGTARCATCHEAQATTVAAAAHRSLSCESCHGPMRGHNGNMPRMLKDASPEACLVCHATLQARPASFPQIASFAAHMQQQGQPLEPGMTCLDCHDAHEPM